MDHRAYEGSVGMLNTPYVKKDTIKNYFPLPNAIFDLGLHHMEINIYAYLLRIEDRRTYQCIVSYGRLSLRRIWARAGQALPAYAKLPPIRVAAICRGTLRGAEYPGTLSGIASIGMAL